MLLHLIGRWFRVIVLVAGRQPYGADQHSGKGYAIENCCSHYHLCLELQNTFREDVPEFEVEGPSCQRLAELVPDLFIHQVMAFQGDGIFVFVGQ